jgi:hypothetical protein
VDAGELSPKDVYKPFSQFIQVTGLVHDLGKLLFFFGAEGQWDVVGVMV